MSDTLFVELLALLTSMKNSERFIGEDMFGQTYEAVDAGEVDGWQKRLDRIIKTL